MFSEKELNGHSLFGRMCNSHKEDIIKPRLDPVRVNAVIGTFATVLITIFLQLIRLDNTLCLIIDLWPLPVHSISQVVYGASKNMGLRL